MLLTPVSLATKRLSKCSRVLTRPVDDKEAWKRRSCDPSAPTPRREIWSGLSRARTPHVCVVRRRWPKRCPTSSARRLEPNATPAIRFRKSRSQATGTAAIGFVRRVCRRFLPAIHPSPTAPSRASDPQVSAAGAATTRLPAQCAGEVRRSGVPMPCTPHRGRAVRSTALSARQPGNS
jgi:hypothetical protein